MSALYIQLPKVLAKGVVRIGNAIGRAVESFIVDPIISILVHAENYIRQLVSKIPGFSWVANDLPSGRSTEKNKRGDAGRSTTGLTREQLLKRNKARALARKSNVNTTDIQHGIAAGDIIGESAAIRAGGEVGASSRSAIGESTTAQVTAIAETTNTIVNTNNNNNGSPFADSPLWTDMSDVMTGGSI